MDQAKEVLTPMSSTHTLVLNDGSKLVDATTYRTILGSLQYFSLTRPYVAYSVNKLAQHMHAPREQHWTTTKRLLRYLKATTSYSLCLGRKTSMVLHAFSDADWAGDQDDHISTIAYVVFMGANPISWSSKKQKYVSLSSTKSEYKAIAHTDSEVNWILSTYHLL